MQESSPAPLYTFFSPLALASSQPVSIHLGSLHYVEIFFRELRLFYSIYNQMTTRTIDVTFCFLLSQFHSLRYPKLHRVLLFSTFKEFNSACFHQKNIRVVLHKKWQWTKMKVGTLDLYCAKIISIDVGNL